MHAFNLTIDPQVAASLHQGLPCVALESTVIAHGLPYPLNLETARAMEKEVANEGACPATLAIIDGIVHQGLSASDMERLAKGHDVMKLSRRDVAFCLANKRTGATTVSATMLLAKELGIRVFATGGLGGVHQGVEASWDISADLIELSRTPVLVVCSGAKSILDLPKTLEFLETQGVPVIGYRCDDFPSFYSRSSGLPAPLRANSPEEIAQIAKMHWKLGGSGIVVAQPIPEEMEIEASLVQSWVDEAYKQAHLQGIQGRNLTPFLLKYLKEVSQGKTLQANQALLIHNAKLAGAISKALNSPLSVV